MKRTCTLLFVLAFSSCAPTTEEMPPPTVGDETAHQGVEADPPGYGNLNARETIAPPTGRYAQPPAHFAADDETKDVERGRAALPSVDSASTERAPARESSVDYDRARAHDEAYHEASQPSPRPPPGPESRGAAGKSRKADLGDLSGMVGPSPADRAAGRSHPSPVAAPPPIEERPGLATSGGETRHSSVHEVSFVRDRSGPNYVGTLHYNNRSGASALAGSYPSLTAAEVNMSAALTVSLLDQYGRTLPAYRGNGRTVAIGENGERYSVLIHNHTNERFEVVVSVDGLDVLDGSEAGVSKRGYLVEPFGTVEIEGFRQSENAVAAFRFGSVKDSYAAQTGSACNVGVIGVAAFGERGYMARLDAYRARVAAEGINRREIVRRESADPFPNRYAVPPLQVIR